ncbi:MAG: hypothetical protein L6R39_004615 [Caloplaca ligustica]|nr:MAG: hypothetical protein L6R39_004615 [Caloplaca ligustica]
MVLTYVPPTDDEEDWAKKDGSQAIASEHFKYSFHSQGKYIPAFDVRSHRGDPNSDDFERLIHDYETVSRIYAIFPCQLVTADTDSNATGPPGCEWMVRFVISGGAK